LNIPAVFHKVLATTAAGHHLLAVDPRPAGGRPDMAWHVDLAYIDPVSGSILIQAIVAAGAGSVAFFRRSIWAIVRRFSGRKDETTPPSSGSGDARSD
jgi:hypothetical protein